MIFGGALHFGYYNAGLPYFFMIEKQETMLCLTNLNFLKPDIISLLKMNLKFKTGTES
jgi:hypothetical protein